MEHNIGWTRRLRKKPYVGWKIFAKLPRNLLVSITPKVSFIGALHRQILPSRRPQPHLHQQHHLRQSRDHPLPLLLLPMQHRQPPPQQPPPQPQPLPRHRQQHRHPIGSQFTPNHCPARTCRLRLNRPHRPPLPALQCLSKPTQKGERRRTFSKSFSKTARRERS